jgi:uncharacterized protein
MPLACTVKLIYLLSFKQSRELSELFMKTTEEITLWRMLRRFSNQVKTELDSTHLDKATGIKAYRMKDIRLSIDQSKDMLIVASSMEVRQIELKWLTQNPATVFKKISELLSIK